MNVIIMWLMVLLIIRIVGCNWKFSGYLMLILFCVFGFIRLIVIVIGVMLKVMFIIRLLDWLIEVMLLKFVMISFRLG